MTRLSGITPSGHVQLGNYLGAVRRWVANSTQEDLYFVSDLHAMTSAHNPAMLRTLTRASSSPRSSPPASTPNWCSCSPT